MSALTKLYRGETTIGFIASRKRWYLASALLLLVCVLSFLIRGFNVGVEFKGGSSFTILTQGTSLTATEVSTAFADAGFPAQDAPQTVGSGSSAKIVINTKTLTAPQVDQVTKSVTSKLGIKSGLNPQTFGSQWGHDTTVNALEGLIIFLIVVSIYISLRFQWRMAVGGILALLHDLVVAAGVYSIVGFEVTPSTVVGLLTILGFSLYDTVVVYDKVGENSKDILAGSRITFSEAANSAVNQTLMRSINTSLIALLPVAGLLFVGAGILGVGTIKDLALILFVGLASGAYSSLFLATPIVVDLTEREPAYKALTRRVAAKRSSDAKRQADAELTGTVLTKRSGAPAPAPKVGAKPQRRRR